jgi:ABC-type Mn2+/Zn2+ transport system permease subunit
MAFFSDTVSHAALLGVAIGFWQGWAEPTVPMIVVGLAVAAAILWLKDHTELFTDTILALLLSGSVSAGMVMLSLLQANRGDIHRYLFGDILAIGPLEVWLAVGLTLAAGTAAFVRLSDLTLLTAQEEIAHVCGLPVRRLNYVFVLALTATVALSIRLLGIILVGALLVIPPAAARNISRSLRQQIVFSLVIGLLGGLGGALLSCVLDVPCGPTIVLTCVAVFLLTLLPGRWRK